MHSDSRRARYTQYIKEPTFVSNAEIKECVSQLEAKLGLS